jgi:hypothetical protein
MGKLVALVWLPASIGVTALAVASIIEQIHPGAIQWMAPFAAALKLYSGFTQQLNAPLSGAVHQFTNMTVPTWVPDGIVAYAASASGFAMGSTNFTSQEDQFSTLRSSAASMGWPLAILAFAWNAIRNRTIGKFAAQHTSLFVLYIVAVGAVLAGAHWGSQFLASPSA